MSEPADPTAPKSATEKLAELVAKKASGAGVHGGPQGRRQTERVAAAAAASKSRPALRKS